jgi:3D (Asp-Asp-Asp) domain-containing protein
VQRRYLAPAIAVMLGSVVALCSAGCAKPIRVVPATATTPVGRSAAYCSGTTTTTGTRVRAGIVAADPDVLPMGSVIAIDRIEKLDSRHDGVYTVMDTGSKIRGRRIDIYLKDCREAVRFGRRAVQVTVLRASRSG